MTRYSACFLSIFFNLKLFGIGYDASREEVNKRFRELALRFHPDKFHNMMEKQLADTRMKILTNARRVLVDPVLRQKHNDYIIRKNVPMVEGKCCRKKLVTFAGIISDM